ncbi:MAG: peptidyl-prolyl cis-trans isomerase [Desulfovibrionaceae bacterium]|nr:peptidyl-prolyl cis-trans isomerase [Desulfovibrionaceae bacterium]MBF0513604.1 peptidyl-prolyl cis-trans isomerase [Desulfovibrionaceae bacterium]
MARNFAAACCLALLCACSSPSAGVPAAGIAAMVDGRPIGLRQLEYYYDLVMLGSMSDNATLSRLASGYGEALTELIVEELALRDLEKAGHPVSEQDVETALAALRRDYPGDSFEKMLAEEAIDPALLRGRLRGRAAMEKLASVILRPGVSISAEEAQGYYRANAAVFGRPAKLRLTEQRAATKEEAKKIQDGGRKPASGEAAQAREIVAVEDKLPAEWREAVKKLKTGETSPPIPDKPGYVVLTLVERVAAKPADPVQAYPRVEAALLDVKLRQAFTQWLEDDLAKAVITVNPAISLATAKEAAQGAAGADQNAARETTTPAPEPVRDDAVARSDEDKSSEELAREAGK